MTRNAKITTEWADGEYDFRLGIGELEELEEKTRRDKADGSYTYIGPVKLFDLLIGSDWLTRDVRQTIRIGLIGAGTKPQEATRLVQRYVDDVPDWHANARLAAAIVGAALSGFDVEPLGKAEAAMGETKSTTIQTDDSHSPHTTPTRQ